MAWHVLVPVKPLNRVKSRLVDWPEPLRRRLVLAMLENILSAVTGCPEVVAVAVDVLSDDPATVACARPHGGRGVPGLPPGLDAALTAAARREPGAARRGTLALMADLPTLDAATLAGALRLAAAHRRSIVADHDGTGTSLLATAPGCSLLPAFGPGSAQRHRRGGAVALTADDRVRRDVDVAEDLLKLANGLPKVPRTCPPSHHVRPSTGLGLHRWPADALEEAAQPVAETRRPCGR